MVVKKKIKMKTRFYIVLVLTIFFSACSPQPKPISYGHDDCKYCKMTIADNRYGAEFVTDKGKVYKFDAIECMVDYVNSNTDLAHAFLLVNTYDNPSKLVETENCTFLISDKMPSPMGAYLTAFYDRVKADSMQKVKSGTLYTWNEILKLRKKD